MRIPPPGNASGKFDVGAHDMGGWVRVFAGQTGANVEDLGFYLAHRPSEWCRQNPHLRLISVVPISRDGKSSCTAGTSSTSSPTGVHSPRDSKVIDRTPGVYQPEG